MPAEIIARWLSEKLTSAIDNRKGKKSKVVFHDSPKHSNDISKPKWSSDSDNLSK